MNAIQIKNITKRYKGVTALDDVSLSFEFGKIYGFLGRNGAGKSTLLNMLGGLDTPTEGSIRVGDTELAKLNSEQATIFRRKQIGFIFQNYNLVPVFSVWENIIFPISLDGRKPDKKFIMGIVKLLGLEKKLDSLPNNLSGGQQQRVAIARSLIYRPALLLADEPTGNLDRKNGEEIIDLLKLSNRNLEQTILLITHDEKIALEADRVITIEDGKIVGDQKRR